MTRLFIFFLLYYILDLTDWCFRWTRTLCWEMQ